MRRFFLSFLLMFLAAGAMAQATPDIRIKTNIYAKEGPTNTFTLVLGAAEGHTGYADIKCSGGNSSEANIITAEYDSESMALLGTNIACQVNEEGVVEVFCDDDVVIDYLSCTGAEITSVEFKNPENIEILALEHNALESLDLTPFTKLQALYLNDNPFNRAPLTITGSKPTLQILEMSLIENVDPNFDIAGFPNLVVFDAMSTPGLQRLTPSACPKLQKLSIDNTSVASLDVRNNPNLYILNISETRIPSIDLSKSTKLQQFYATHSSAFNKDVKLTEIDVTHCPNLIYLFLNDNHLTTLDLTKCPALRDIYVRNNYLTSLDLSKNRDLINVFISGNCMDFNSLPIPQETWGDFEYKQRPLTVPGAYLAGAPLDLTGNIVRPDMETFAAVFTVSEDNPELSVPLDESKYTFSNGVLTIKEVLADSVYASFFNAIFPDIELTTTKFRVKDTATFGQPDLAATIGNSLTAGTPVKIFVGMKGATAAQPKQFFVDLGDGQLQPFQATGERTPAEANVATTKAKFGTMKLYVPEGEELTAFKIADFKLISLDLSNSRSLAELTLTGTALTKLDLQWNRCLQSVDITGNNFGADFTLAGANGSYGKNILSHICLSNNGMTAVKLNEPGSWNYIDLSHNQLTEFNFTDADYVQYLDVSHNAFETLKINYLGQLKTFYCNDNQLREIVLPETNVIETFNCANNCFTLATLPLPSSANWTTYTYAPQAQIEIPTKGPGYNLSDQYVEADGQATVFTWKKADGAALTLGSDYTCDKGVTHFNDNTIGQTLYCEMTHAAFPQLTGTQALTTTPILSAGMPTHLLATFVTPVGHQTARLSMTSSVPNNAIYIDWTGTQSLEQYPITNTTYTVFDPTTTEGAKVSVWSYDADDHLTVFSLSGVTLADVDCSPMTQLTCFSLSGSGISDLKWPASPGLTELSLDGCNFTSLDFSRYPELYFVNLDDNQFTSIDLSGLTKLGSVGLANNRLTEVKLKNNRNLWGLALTNNQLEHIDLAGAPNLSQLFLNHNRLSSIDLSPLYQLRVLYLDNNRFDFSNLPIPRAEWTLYTYGNQPTLRAIQQNGVVDLSSQKERDGVATVYTWFYGTPTLDPDTGELTGELLIENDEFSLENGVTTFHTDLDKVCCVLTNALFPDMYLQTNELSVNAFSDGIRTTDTNRLAITIEGRTLIINGAADGAVFAVYSAAGQLVGRATAKGGKAVLNVRTAGTYIVATKGGEEGKVLVR